MVESPTLANARVRDDVRERRALDEHTVWTIGWLD